MIVVASDATPIRIATALRWGDRQISVKLSRNRDGRHRRCCQSEPMGRCGCRQMASTSSGPMAQRRRGQRRSATPVRVRWRPPRARHDPSADGPADDAEEAAASRVVITGWRRPYLRRQEHRRDAGPDVGTGQHPHQLAHSCDEPKLSSRRANRSAVTTGRTRPPAEAQVNAHHGGDKRADAMSTHGEVVNRILLKDRRAPSS